MEHKYLELAHTHWYILCLMSVSEKGMQAPDLQASSNQLKKVTGTLNQWLQGDA